MNLNPISGQSFYNILFLFWKNATPSILGISSEDYKGKGFVSK
jgi:hypothetical protein